MHISDTRHSNTILTKCTKMTEEKHHIHNGAVKHEAIQGGRLKFFKDGKFILELERAREGERVSWVSVPRKTFWPPQGTAASTPTFKQESSVSDDNSSIQSSPWQRDHSWKQSSPRRDQSKELVFFFFRPRSLRRPHLPCRPRRPFSLQCGGSGARCRRRHATLLAVVQLLGQRSVPAAAAADVVSPRKRFLREMDKEDMKRSRNKAKANGAVEEAKPPPQPPKNCSSYSITSLLADDKKQASPCNSPSHFNNVTQQHYATTEERWYSESVDRLRSIELSQAEKRNYASYPHHPSYLPHYVYPYSLPSFYGPNVYNRGGYMMPPLYHAPPLPLAMRHPDTPSCSSWASNPPTSELEHRDENVTDMPLNLSKHAG